MTTRLPFILGFRQNLFPIYFINNPFIMRLVAVLDILYSSLFLDIRRMEIRPNISLLT